MKLLLVIGMIFPKEKITYLCLSQWTNFHSTKVIYKNY